MGTECDADRAEPRSESVFRRRVPILNVLTFLAGEDVERGAGAVSGRDDRLAASGANAAAHDVHPVQRRPHLGVDPDASFVVLVETQGAGQDRVLALDSLYVNALLLLVTFGIRTGSAAYFEVALVISVLSFVATVALAKFLMRGEVIE